MKMFCEKNQVLFPLEKQLFLREGFQGEVSRDKFIHGIIQKQASAAKMLKPEVYKMLQEETYFIINFIKKNKPVIYSGVEAIQYFVLS